jgi:hypothetical protein
MKRKRNSGLFLLIACYSLIHAQTRLYARVSPTEKSIQLKWYGTDVINTTGYDLYREEDGAGWKKITNTPILRDKHKIKRLCESSDQLIASAAKLCESSLSSLSLLTVILSSFKSPSLCEAIGIWYEDTTVKDKHTYRYQLVKTENTIAKVEAQTGTLTAGAYTRETYPQDLTFKKIKNKAFFSWKEESARYYGVKVFRRQADASVNRCLTEQPILFTDPFPDAEKFMTRFTDLGPKEGGRFYYTFYGLDFFGDLTQVSPSLLVSYPDLEAPPPPENFKIEVKGRMVKATFDPVKNCSDLKDYQLFRTTRNDTDFSKIKTFAASTVSCMTTDSVPFFQSYIYKLIACDLSGNHSVPRTLLAEVPDLAPPATPGELKAHADSGKIILQWKTNAEKDLAGYLLYRSINDTSSASFVKITPRPITDAVYTDELPANAKNSFYYKIYAVDQDLNRSRRAASISCRLPDRQAPSAPFIESAVFKKNNTIEITWFKNPELDLQTYQLYYVKADSGQREARQKLERDKTTFVFTKCEAGMIYKFRMTAEDSSGNKSSYSNTVQCRVPASGSEEYEKLRIKLRYEKKTRKANFKWQKLPGDSVRYVLFRKTPSESLYFPLTGVLSDGSYQEKVPAGGETEYQLRAYLSDGSVIKSNIQKIKTHEKEKRSEE